MEHVDSYRERVRWPGWFMIALGLILVGAYAAISKRPETPAWALAVGAVPLLLVAYAIWRLRFLEIEFSPKGIGFGFGGVRHRVPRDRLLGAEAADYPAVRYMGWGYRLGWEKRERAYSILGCPRGVFVTFDDDRGRRWKVFLSSRAPEKAVAALQS